MIDKHRSTQHVRLTKPLVRVNGVLEEVSWDDALKRAGALFAHLQETRGSNAVGVFSCSKSTNELNYLASKFARVVLRTHHIDSCNRT